MTDPKDSDLQGTDELRRRAEEHLLERREQPRAGTPGELQRLVHELEVHQIELEMQNAELRQARDQADAVSQRFADLYDFAPVGYFTLDRAGTIKAVNHLGATLIGVERARLLGRRLGAFIPAGARSSFSQFLGDVFARQGKASRELPFSMEGGETRFLQVEVLADPSGTECRLAAIDITERRRAEAELAGKRQELQEVNRSLEAGIAQAVDELRRKDELLIVQDRLAVMGEMINNIAHQWIQPLNTLGLIIQQLPMYHASGELSAVFLEEHTARSMELIQHMSQTVEVFRNLFKVDKEPMPFSVNQVIESTLSLVAQTFEDQGIAVAFHPAGDPVATGFPNEYSQVLLNILLNARDALVERHVDRPLISIHAFAEAGRSVVTIGDNAGGIPPEIMGRLFDAYFTTKDKGSGIGLFMSRSIIEKSMGGSLAVRNTGAGAEFRIEV